jgi:diguanylate cyclase (GGDEF)-like protein
VAGRELVALLTGPTPAVGRESGNVVARRKDGGEVTLEVRLVGVDGDRGRLILLLGRDIGAVERGDPERDPLTGLFGRPRFTRELRALIEQASLVGGRCAVIALDIDNFRFINATRGVARGNELFATIAAAVRDSVRPGDLAARVGGDELAVLLPDADAQLAERLARGVLDEIRSRALYVDGEAIHATASIGVALYDGRDILGEDLLVEADLAMHQAKEEGRDRVVLYSPTERVRAQAQTTWAEQIRAALQRDAFLLYCQPVQHVASGEIAQWELLLRVRQQDGQILPPGAFLPIAERFGLMEAVDRWVVRQAIWLISSRNRAGRSLRLEVNVASRSIADPRLSEIIERELADSGIDPADVIFEITETTAFANPEEVAVFAARLKALGCGFALDDFGTGFASLAHLKHLPIDYVKIDGEFVRDLPENVTDQRIVQSVVSVARALGQRTIAEFVGDEDTVDLLREFGVDFAQGYHVGMPRPVAEL